MLCKRCKFVMRTGTRYEQRKGRNRPFYRRFYECKKCGDRVYTNNPSFQEIFKSEISRNR